MKELILAIDLLQNTKPDVSDKHLSKYLNERFFTCCTHAILPNQTETVNDVTKSSQHTGTRRERFEWAKDRFALSPNFEKYMQENYQYKILSINSPSKILEINGNYIYCIDDVITTGASMQAVSKLLEAKFDVQVIKFCICH